jgi:hypothetical protein
VNDAFDVRLLLRDQLLKGHDDAAETASF